MDFQTSTKIINFFLSKNADFDITEDSNGNQIEAIWVEDGRNFRALLLNSFGVLETADAEFENTTDVATTVPTVDWFKFAVREARKS